MNATTEEAMDVIRGWMNARAPLTGIFRSSRGDVMFHFGGYLNQLAPDGGEIKHADGSFTFAFSLVTSTWIDYQDPREAPKAVADWAEATIVSALVIKFPTAHELILYEIQRDVAAAQQRA